MEKIKLNNQIVSMRKYVKQAKVHVINKFVKQIKFLQNRKGSDAQIQKAKRKAERFLEAVALVKKIKPDDVSKLTLSKAKNWKDVLQQKNSTLHDRCIAMVANYGAVQKEVETFYNANKELVLKIADYITQWEDKNKFSKDSPETNKHLSEGKSNNFIKSKNLKDENLSGNKKSNFKIVVKPKDDAVPEKNDKTFKITQDDENIHLKAKDSNSDVDEEEITSIAQKLSHKYPIKSTEETRDLLNDKSSSMEIEVMDNSDEESESDENGEDEEITGNSLNNNEQATKDFSDKAINLNEIYKTASTYDSQLKKDSHTKNKLKAIALLNLNELEGVDEIPVSSSAANAECDEKESSEDEINETFKHKSNDPFFLGHCNEDSNVKELNDSSNDSDVNLRTKDTAHSFNYRTEAAKNSFFHRKDNFSPKKFFQKSPHNHRNVSKSFRNERNNEKPFKRDKFTQNNYHNKFQEKNKVKEFKVSHAKPYSVRDTFDKKQFKNISRGYGNNDDAVSLKNKGPNKKDNASGPLHPSWEARRKQKELSSTSFQGKRMVFND